MDIACRLDARFTPVYTCSCSACSMYTECEHHVPPVPVMVHGGTSRVPDGTSTVLPGYPTVLQKYLSGTWDGTQRYFQSTQQYFRGVSAVLWMVPNGSTVMVNGTFVVSFDAYCTCAVMYLIFHEHVFFCLHKLSFGD